MTTTAAERSAPLSASAPGAAPTPEAAAAAGRVPAYSWYALAVLTAVYVLNFLDRSLMYILFAPMKKEMAFTDLQLALLGTTSFVIFYTLLGIPFGRLADRTVRKYLIAGGLAVWSLFSGLTGFAEGFWSIFVCRLMVGVGEATLGPSALSLLSDYFPPKMRATVQSIYSTGIAIGGGLAFFLGGWIGQAHGWRWAFYLLGFPGLLLAVVVFLLREPPRGATEAAPARAAAGAAGADWRALLRSAPLRYHYVGFALFALAANNLGIWGPTFFVRVHRLSLLEVGTMAGLLSIVVGIPAMIVGGYYADRLSRRLRGGRMAFSALTAASAIPLWVGVLFVDHRPSLLALNVALYGLLLTWVGPATAEVHDIAGPSLRGVAIGIFFSLVNIVAYGVGAPVIGQVSDALGVAADPGAMRLSLLLCPAVCGLGAALLWLGSRARARELGR
ncbi:MAG TPA: MFS transporter [Polyangiaceae bacterium]|nr:MFS transporter [Polyangiaceae bacterium]